MVMEESQHITVTPRLRAHDQDSKMEGLSSKPVLHQHSPTSPKLDRYEMDSVEHFIVEKMLYIEAGAVCK